MKILLLLLILLLSLIAYGIWKNQHPTRIGVTENSLQPCPDSPNCVFSGSSDKLHQIDPLPLPANRNPIDLAEEVVMTFPGSRIIEKSDRYLHAEFRSDVFRFIDDVEFYLPENGSSLQVRSASRVGYSDLGVNRSRVEEIRKRYHNLAK